MMEGRRIVTNPRPCNGRRVVANKRSRPNGFVNSVKKLQRREICSCMDRAFSISTAHERFRNMRLVEEYDTHDPKGHCLVALPFLMKRSKVIEIVAARDIVFTLALSGVCASFGRDTSLRPYRTLMDSLGESCFSFNVSEEEEDRGMKKKNKEKKNKKKKNSK